ncbi:MAG: hypothetical protein MUF64_25385 [Polyangiaceae bacterium]|nr:hypothetical protein [Polyangiaceae bacterium]
MNEIWGRPPATARLFAIRQMGADDSYAGQPTTSFDRGVSVLLESTDCGAAWTYRSMIDCCDPNAKCDGACKKGGTDRPQSGAHTSVTGYAYINVGTFPTDGEKEPIFRANLGTPGQATWLRVHNSESPAEPLSVDDTTVSGNNLSGCTLPSRPVAMGNKVFWACQQPASPSWVVRLLYFDESSGAIRSDSNFNKPTREWQEGLSWPVLSPITQLNGASYLRIVYPTRIGSSGNFRQQLNILVVRERNGIMEEISSASFTSNSSTGSVIYPSFALPVETQNQKTDLALLSWLETTSSDQATNGDGMQWGDVMYRGCILRGIDPTCTPLTLSRNNGADQSWPYTNYDSFLQSPGDYHESAGYFHTASGKYRFLAHYIQAAAGEDVLRANWVEVDP